MRMCSARRTRFPYADDRSYTPPDAPLEKYLAMLDTIGFARGVLVQGSAHGRDNSAMLDALARRPDRLRGVAVADADVAPAMLARVESPRRSRLALQSFFSRRPIALSRRRAADRGAEARARDGRTRLASAALDRREGFAADDSGPEIAGPARRDRPHGPHRCPRRHRHGRLPEPVARGRRRLVLGQTVRRASPQPERA